MRMLTGWGQRFCEQDELNGSLPKLYKENMTTRKPAFEYLLTRRLSACYTIEEFDKAVFSVAK